MKKRLDSITLKILAMKIEQFVYRTYSIAALICLAIMAISKIADAFISSNTLHIITEVMLALSVGYAMAAGIVIAIVVYKR